MMALWRDWVMMNRLRCTWSQLRAEPLEETLIFSEFMAGEEEAMAEKRREASGGR